MKKLNVFLLIVLLLMIAFVVYFFAGGALRVESSVITAPAAEHAEAFASIRSVLSSNAAPQRFADALPESAEGLTLVDVTLTLSNPGLFPAEWLDLTVSPADDDVAVYSLTGEGGDVPGRSTATVNLKLLTAAGSASRTVTIQYYVFGLSRTVTVRV